MELKSKGTLCFRKPQKVDPQNEENIAIYIW